MPAPSRRQMLLAAAPVSALTAYGLAAALPSADPAGVYDRSDELEHQYNAYVGLFATNIASGRTLAHRDDDPFAMRSTFKAYAAARVLQKAQRGELDLQQGVFVGPTALLPNSPVTAPQAGNTMRLAQLCAAAVQRSDNGEPQRRQLQDWMRGTVTSGMRAGLPPGWTTADKTGTADYGSTNDIGIAYGPEGQRVLLSLMTRSHSPNQDADPLRALIADATRSVLPWLTGQG